MIEAKVTSTASRTLRASVFLKNQLRRSVRLERGLEKKSITLKTKLLKDRDRTLKALLSRSTEDKKDKKGVVGTLGLLGGGLIGRRFLGRGGGGIGRVPKIPKLPTRGGAVLSRASRFGRLGRVGPLAVVGTGLDFAGRKAEGQTNLQAGVGAGGGLAGALAGAKAGAVLGTAFGGPIGTVVGGVGGSIIGSLAGGRLADLFTGADRRRKFEERRAILSSEKTLFSEALDDLDKVLEKLEDTNFIGAIRKAKDDELEKSGRRPIIYDVLGLPKLKGKTMERVIAEETAKTLAAIGITFLLLPSDPSDLVTTGPLLVKLRSLIKSSRLVKFFTKSKVKVKPNKLDDFDELIPGVDIPGISAKGIRIRAQALLKKLNPNIKFDNVPKSKPSLKELLKKEKQLQDKLYQIIKNASPEKAREILQKFIKEGKLDKVPRTIKKKGDVKVNVDRAFPSGSPDMTGTNSNPLGSGGTPLSMNQLESNDNNNIALAPTQNIFLIREGDTNISPPAVFNEGDTIVVGGSGSSDNLDKYFEMTQLFTT